MSTAGCGADGRQRSSSIRVRCSTLSRSMWSPRVESGCSSLQLRRAIFQRLNPGCHGSSPASDHSLGSNSVSSPGVGVEGASRCVAMINFFLSSPPALGRVLGVSAAGCHADVSGVVGQAQFADEVGEKHPFGTQRGKERMRPWLACVACCDEVGQVAYGAFESVAEIRAPAGLFEYCEFAGGEDVRSDHRGPQPPAGRFEPGWGFGRVGRRHGSSLGHRL
jgi:hypothetical protein